MKKSLFSVLASALLVVGCQNYDDQFSNLESQISALATTVAGLSQVQTDVANLANTVNSLSSTVNGLGDEIDTAVSDGLADITADIEAIETAVADVASSEEVSALQEAVDASQEDLTSLLENAAIFQGNVIINSNATLDVYEKMGTGINIVNGYVKITVTADMDMAKVQTVVDNVLTTVLDFTYTSPSSDIAEITFTNLTGTQSLTVTQAGGYDFRNLTSATNITLGDSFKSSIRVIHFGSLLNATSFTTGSTASTIAFSKATELHLTSLKRFSTASASPLVLEVDEGSVIDLTALDDVGVDSEQEDLFLEITGPSSFTASKFTDGALTFTDVATVVVNDFNGTITTNGGVESFTANKLVDAYTVGADIEILDVTGAVDPDLATDQSGPSISSTSGNLESATIGGNVAAISLVGSNLETVVITADVAGAISISDSDDLVTVTLTGSKAKSVTIDDCDELASLTIDTTIQKGRSTTAALTAKLTLDGSVVVTDNTDLSSLTISSSDLAVLTVTGNTDLETIEGSGIIAIGATAKNNAVTINGNNFTATKATDKTNTAATLTGDGKANDLGSFTSVSGMSTLKDYLALVSANTLATAAVYYDTVESLISTAGSETATDQTFAANPTNTRVLVQSAADITAGTASTKEKVAVVIPLSSLSNTSTFTLEIGGTQILQTGLVSGVAGTRTPGSTNGTLVKAIFEESFATTRALSLGATLTAVDGGNPTADITFYSANAVTSTFGATGYGENYSLASTVAVAAAAAVMQGVANTATADVIKLTINSQSVTATASNTGAALDDEVATNLAAAWAAKWGTGGTSDTLSLIDVSATGAVLTVSSKDNGRRADNADIALVMTQGSSTLGTPTLAWKIGSDFLTSDNKMVGKDIIVMLEAITGGGNSSEVKAGQVTLTINNVSALASNTLTVSTTLDVTAGTNTSTLTSIYPTEGGRNGDAVNAENGTPDITNSAAVNYTRVHWLAD